MNKANVGQWVKRKQGLHVAVSCQRLTPELLWSHSYLYSAKAPQVTLPATCLLSKH